jgi:hypothetical protein
MERDNRHRRERHLTGLGASCDVVWGPRITYGLPTTHKLSGQTASKALFLLEICRAKAVIERQGDAHTKFAASSMLPVPLYRATCG